METCDWQRFQDYGLWQVLGLTNIQKEEWQLEVESSQAQRRLFFSKNDLLWVESQHPEENIVQVFLDQELFELDQYLRAAANFNEDLALEESLVASGLITLVQMQEGLREWAYRVLKGSLQQKEGRYRIISSVKVPGGSRLHLALSELLFRCYLEVDDKTWVMDQFSNSLNMVVARLKPLSPGLHQATWFEPFVNVADALKLPQTFKHLALNLPLGEFQLLRFILAGWRLGFLEVKPEAEESRSEIQADSSLSSQQFPPEQMMGSPVARRRSVNKWLVSAACVLGLIMVLWFFGGRHNQKSEEQVSPQQQVHIENDRDSGLGAASQELPSQVVQLNLEDLNLALSQWQEQNLSASKRFSLGIYMVCDPNNALSLWQELIDDPNFFCLPYTFQDQACYWVLWGRFDSRRQALEARGSLPEVLKRVAPDADAIALDRIN